MYSIQNIGAFKAAAIESERTGKPIFVLFTSPETCVFCRNIEAGILSSQAFEEWAEEKIAVRVEFSKSDSLEENLEKRNLREEFEAEGFPSAFIAICEGGEVYSLGEVSLDSMEDLEESEQNVRSINEKNRIFL
jgi:thioredoxin-related protein